MVYLQNRFELRAVNLHIKGLLPKSFYVHKSGTETELLSKKKMTKH